MTQAGDLLLSSPSVVSPQKRGRKTGRAATDGHGQRHTAPADCVSQFAATRHAECRAMSESLSSSAQQGFAALWEYVKEHGTARSPRSYQTASGFRLGEWVSRRRKLHGKDPQIDRLLESLPGWTWTPFDYAFAEKLDQLKQVMASDHPVRDQRLRSWIQTQRNAARKGILSQERLELLRAAGVSDLHMHTDQSKNMCNMRTEW